jgi:hypothetical protein
MSSAEVPHAELTPTAPVVWSEPTRALRRVFALLLMLLAVVITLSAGFGSVFALASWLVLRMRGGLSWVAVAISRASSRPAVAV